MLYTTPLTVFLLYLIVLFKFHKFPSDWKHPFSQMALELCSENSSRAMSPRISFSHDLSQSDLVPVEHLLLRSISPSSSYNLDFNFCTPQTPDHHRSSMADEIFSNGKILSTQIKKLPSPQPPQIIKPLPQPTGSNPQQENADPFKTPEEKQNSKSFWGFKRSSSCGNGYARTLCPLPLLSRSISTGSSTSSKRSTSSSKDHSVFFTEAAIEENNIWVLW